MICTACRKEMACRQGDHHYTASGLNNIYLSNIEIWTCECGEEVVGIPSVPDLHSFIAEGLLRKRSMLTGSEIRFLRKNMTMPAKNLATLLGVDPSTVSRWENGRQVPDRANEKLIRVIYAYKKRVSQNWLLEIMPEIGAEQVPSEMVLLSSEAWVRNGEITEACVS